MTDNYSIKLSIEGNNLRKNILEDHPNRSWILLTCNGLPFRHLISVIEETHTCIECGERLFTTEISDRHKSTDHKNTIKPTVQYYSTLAISTTFNACSDL